MKVPSVRLVKSKLEAVEHDPKPSYWWAGGAPSVEIIRENTAVEVISASQRGLVYFKLEGTVYTAPYSSFNAATCDVESEFQQFFG